MPLEEAQYKNLYLQPMNKLFNFFLDLCLLRVAPQDVPTAPVLFWITALANITVNIIILWADPKRSSLQILSESLFDVSLTMLALHIALSWYNLETRFNQTATAIFGTNALLGLIAAFLPNSQHGIIGEIWILLLLSLLIWQFLVLGHILRHTFEIPLSLAIIAGIIYTFMSYRILNIVFSTI